TALDQLRRQNSHRAVGCRKSFVHLGHGAAYRTGPLDQVDVIAAVCHIQRSLNSGDAAPNDHYASYFVFEINHPLTLPKLCAARLVSRQHKAIRHQLPDVFHIHLEVVLPAKAFHYLVPAVVAGGNYQACPGILDLAHLETAMKDSFLLEGHCPPATSGPAAEVVGARRVNIDEVWNAFSYDGSGLFKITVAEHLQRLAPVVARIGIGSKLSVARRIDVNASFLDIAN